MKTTTFFLISFILCIFTANSAPDLVVDFRGGIIRTGVEYYAVPTSINGTHGSIGPATVGNNSCRAGVVEYQTQGRSHPFTITPVDPKDGVIRLSTDVNINFTGSTICDESNVWKVEYDNAMKQFVVMMGGVEGNSGPETLDNWFKIETIVDGYKLVYCPSVCSYCKVMCKDVGTAIDNNGMTRFVLGGDPFSFNFVGTDFIKSSTRTNVGTRLITKINVGTRLIKSSIVTTILSCVVLLMN